MDKATRQKIEALEARIKQLEMRPPVYVPYPVYTPMPHYQQPYYVPTPPVYPYPSPWWGINTTGYAQTQGINNHCVGSTLTTSGTTAVYSQGN